MITERLTWPQYSSYTPNSLSPYGYDSVWALALMLNRSAELLKTKIFKDGSKRKLEDFTYEDREMMLLFFDVMNETQFLGLTVW